MPFLIKLLAVGVCLSLLSRPFGAFWAYRSGPSGLETDVGTDEAENQTEEDEQLPAEPIPYDVIQRDENVPEILNENVPTFADSSHENTIVEGNLPDSNSDLSMVQNESPDTESENRETMRRKKRDIDANDYDDYENDVSDDLDNDVTGDNPESYRRSRSLENNGIDNDDEKDSLHDSLRVDKRNINKIDSIKTNNNDAESDVEDPDDNPTAYKTQHYRRGRSLSNSGLDIGNEVDSVDDSLYDKVRLDKRNIYGSDSVGTKSDDSEIDDDDVDENLAVNNREHYRRGRSLEDRKTMRRKKRDFEANNYDEHVNEVIDDFDYDSAGDNPESYRRSRSLENNGNDNDNEKDSLHDSLRVDKRYINKIDSIKTNNDDIESDVEDPDDNPTAYKTQHYRRGRSLTNTGLDIGDKADDSVDDSLNDKVRLDKRNIYGSDSVGTNSDDSEIDDDDVDENLAVNNREHYRRGRSLEDRETMRRKKRDFEANNYDEHVNEVIDDFDYDSAGDNPESYRRSRSLENNGIDNDDEKDSLHDSLRVDKRNINKIDSIKTNNDDIESDVEDPDDNPTAYKTQHYRRGRSLSNTGLKADDSVDDFLNDHVRLDKRNSDVSDSVGTNNDDSEIDDDDIDENLAVNNRKHYRRGRSLEDRKTMRRKKRDFEANNYDEHVNEVIDDFDYDAAGDNPESYRRSRSLENNGIDNDDEKDSLHDSLRVDKRNINKIDSIKTNNDDIESDVEDPDDNPTAYKTQHYRRGRSLSNTGLDIADEIDSVDDSLNDKVRLNKRNIYGSDSVGTNRDDSEIDVDDVDENLAVNNREHYRRGRSLENNIYNFEDTGDDSDEESLNENTFLDKRNTDSKDDIPTNSNDEEIENDLENINNIISNIKRTTAGDNTSDKDNEQIENSHSGNTMKKRAEYLQEVKNKGTVDNSFNTKETGDTVYKRNLNTYEDRDNYDEKRRRRTLLDSENSEPYVYTPMKRRKRTDFDGKEVVDINFKDGDDDEDDYEVEDNIRKRRSIEDNDEDEDSDELEEEYFDDDPEESIFRHKRSFGVFSKYNIINSRKRRSKEIDDDEVDDILEDDDDDDEDDDDDDEEDDDDNDDDDDDAIEEVPDNEEQKENNTDSRRKRHDMCNTDSSEKAHGGKAHDEKRSADTCSEGQNCDAENFLNGEDEHVNGAVDDGMQKQRVDRVHVPPLSAKYRKTRAAFAYSETDQGPDEGYSSWTEWSGCSKTCGLGRQFRRRLCHDTKHCRDGDLEERICESKSC